jgi:AcrR family transcriptional regulator
VPPAASTASAPKLTLRERNRLRTRKVLLDAALEVFAEAGYGSATVEAIAAKAGASKVTLYTYFPQGREQLFQEIYEDINNQLLEEATEVYQAEGGTYVERIMGLTHALLDVARSPLIGRFYSIEDPALDIALDPVRGHASRVWTDLIAADLAAARSQGVLAASANPNALAVLLVGAMRSALSDVSQERTDSQDILEAFEVLIRAI